MEEHYHLQVEKLRELESLSSKGGIDLYYGDETHVCSEGYVPYGWQVPGEDVCFLSEKSYKFNCLGLINRQRGCLWQVTRENIDAGLSWISWKDFPLVSGVEHLSYWITHASINPRSYGKESRIGKKGDCTCSSCLLIPPI